jgi:hypothetical protein
VRGKCGTYNDKLVYICAVLTHFLSCEQEKASFESDPKNCGECGEVCGEGENANKPFCKNGKCKKCPMEKPDYCAETNTCVVSNAHKAHGVLISIHTGPELTYDVLALFRI